MLVSRIIMTYIVTFIFFMMESITNYNLGKIENEHHQFNIQYLKKLFVLPSYKELIKIMISVGFFSLLSSLTMKFMEYLFYRTV